MADATLQIHHEAGLHARPLSKFVKLVKQYDADIQVWNLTKDKGPAPGNSPLKLMLLAISKGNEMRIETAGEQAQEALSALVALVENNFEEVPTDLG
ncbi:MAG: HPr family phosphocarrier protein [Ardenticatenaceae bacterium]|nr:HPr family phosphocarrier protein [Ardenticatenaceae bacterium]